MIKYNDTYIIGIDHGYGNLKTANTVTASGVKVHDIEPPFKKELLEFDGSSSVSAKIINHSQRIRPRIWITITSPFTESARNCPLRELQKRMFILLSDFRLCGTLSSVTDFPSICCRMRMWSSSTTTRSTVFISRAFRFIRRDIVRCMTGFSHSRRCEREL